MFSCRHTISTTEQPSVCGPELCTKLGLFGLINRRADCPRGQLTSFQIQAMQLAWERQETESVHFSKPRALDLMLFCIFINIFQWSKSCYSEARNGWKVVLDAFLVLQHVTVNYSSSKKLESKQRPHDSNNLLHYSFLGHAEQSFDGQRSGDKHLDPRMDLNSEIVWSVHFPSGFGLLCTVQGNMGQRNSWQGRAEPRLLRRSLQHTATLMYPV